MIETIPNASALAARLRERIKNEGPIPFYEWMKAALYDRQDGYYCRMDRQKWGREGDYRTSPERSSLFAATFARYFARFYEELGRPAKWTLVEVGAGEGHFANGVLQTFQKFFPDVFAATSYVVDEVSAHSQSLARQRLEAFADRVVFKALDEIQIDPGVVFSNELLDAFPVHRVTVDNHELKEFYVDVGASGKFEWVLNRPTAGALARFKKYFEDCGVELREGRVAEISLDIEAWLGKVANKIRAGFLVTVDYGAAAEDLYSSAGRQYGTLRGFRRHNFVDNLLSRPGEKDLTTTINWSFVKSVGSRLGFEVVAFEQQDRFLMASGLLDQLEVALRQCKGDAERLGLSVAAQEMILPAGMASYFQVLVQRKPWPEDG
jgi:SAM-dependent MidA family methyltransferase